MSLILSIESGTEICSVGLAKDGEIIALRESVEGRDHARLVARFADEVLKEMGVEPQELSAVAVSMGPGSYTGLRIGVSFAKGLCYGVNIPLIGVNSLEALAANAIKTGQCEGSERQNEGDERQSEILLAPMVDARRMEVYTQLFNSAGESEGEIEAKVIDEESFSQIRDKKELIIFGDGAAKCKEALPWVKIIEVAPSAAGVAQIAEAKFQRGEFEDVAYFEPFYLKEVVITTSKKSYF